MTMIGMLKSIALVACGGAVAIQWSVVGERLVAVIWGWYKFRGYGGDTPLVVGREAQLLFYVLSLAFAAVALVVRRTSKGSWYAAVANWELGGLTLAAVVWTAVLLSPLVAPFHSWR